MNSRSSSTLLRLLRGIGPAIIVACIVLGPGSILTSSKVGCEFGYSLAWVLIAAGALMFVAVATAARVGASLERTPFAELAHRSGRPVSVFVGITVFLIAACFQFSNNLGVLAAIEPLVPLNGTARSAILIGLNVLIAAGLFGFQRLYANIERLMMLLMALMLLGFAANLIMAQPSWTKVALGLVPNLPNELAGNFLPSREPGNATTSNGIVDSWITIQALIATSFSIAGAFYQAYLVREKGWDRSDVRRGDFDSLLGTVVLIGITLMIMVTAGTVLQHRINPSELRSAGDVALQLEPLFGPAAKLLFCLGIFAGAISSFLVNAMLGGTFLADGFGQPPTIDSLGTKCYTIGVMLIGMLVALVTTPEGRVPLIVFAQAMTVLGGPVLAIALIYLAATRNDAGQRITPLWMILINVLGAFVIFCLAVRTLMRLLLQLTA